MNFAAVPFRTPVRRHPRASNLSLPGPTNEDEGHRGPHQISEGDHLTIKSKIATAVAIATLAGSLAIPTSAAQARGGWGIGAAVLGAAVVGAAVAKQCAPRRLLCVDGYRRCGWERQYGPLRILYRT